MCESNTSISIYAALKDCPNFNEMKIMGAIVNPLMQCDMCMVEAGMCTQSQFNCGKDKLISHMNQYYESIANLSSKGATEDMGETN